MPEELTWNQSYLDVTPEILNIYNNNNISLLPAMSDELTRNQSYQDVTPEILNIYNNNNNISLLPAMFEERTWSQSHLDVTPEILNIYNNKNISLLPAMPNELTRNQSYHDVTPEIPNIYNNNISLLPAMFEERTWSQSHLDVTPETFNMSIRTETCAVGNVSVEEYLDCLNTSFAERLLPAVTVLAVLMAMGVVGNILVLFMYTCKSKRGTVTLFIQALAVFDLLSCCVAIPGEIIDMTNNYTFGSHSLCKIMRTVNLFCTVSSGATLVVVAIDRYKRICCPLKRQITPKGATVVICICAISTLVLSIPTAILYGGRSIATDLPSVNGTDCSISDQFVNTIFPIAHNSLQMFLFLVGAVTLIVLYSLIGSKVCHHVNQQQVRRKSISVGRSRFSPGGVSMTSVYSVNTNTACCVESGLASFVNGREAAELAERFQSTNTHKDVTVNVGDMPSGNEKESCGHFNSNDRHDCTFVTVDTNLSVHETDCQKIGASEYSLEFTTKFYQQKNEFVDGCDSTSGNKLEVELVKDVLNVKNLVEEGQINEFKQKADLGTKKQTLERTEGERVPENHRSNNTTNDDVSVVNSTLESHLKRCQTEVSTDILVSAAGVACTQSDTCSQNVHRLSQRNVMSLSAQNEDLKNCALLIADSTNVPGESSIDQSTNVPGESSIDESTNVPGESSIDESTNVPGESSKDESTNVPGESSIGSSSAIPSYLSDESANGPLTDSSTNSEHHKLSGLRNEGIDIKRQHDIGKQDQKSSNLSPLPSDNSNSKETLQANNTFFIKTSKSTEINVNLDGKQYKKQNNLNANSNNLVFRPKTKKKAKSCTQKPDYASIVGHSKTPLIRQMSRTAGRSDGHLDRLDEKVKVRETEQNGSRRTTLMLLLITIIYVLSFLPHLIIMALKAVDQDILKGLGAGWEVAENLLIRSYFINSMANPVIYSFFSRNFFRRCRGSRSGWPSG